MRTSESIANLAPALVQAQAEMKAAEKDGLNPAFRSKYTTFASCVEAARPALAKYGLAVIQSPTTGNQSVTVTTRILHKTGEWLEDDFTLPVAKWDAQGIGSATTYAKRYPYCAMLGVVADDDDDGAAAVRPAARQTLTVTAPVNHVTGEETPAILQGSELPPEPTLTVPEQHKLWAVAKARGWTAAEYTHFLQDEYKVGASREIPRSKLAGILATLEAGRATSEAGQ